MSEIEVTVRAEEDGGEVYLKLITSADDVFVILDEVAADLLRDILVHRRAGEYSFGPLDING